MNQSLSLSLVIHLAGVVLLYFFFHHYQTRFQVLTREDKRLTEERRELGRREFSIRQLARKDLEQLAEKTFKALEPRKLEDLKDRLPEPPQIQQLARLLAEQEQRLKGERDPRKRLEARLALQAQAGKLLEGAKAEYLKAAQATLGQLQKDLLKHKFTRKALEIGLPRVRGGVSNILMDFEARQVLLQLWQRVADELRRDLLRLKPAVDAALARHGSEGAPRTRLADPPSLPEDDSDAARAQFELQLGSYLATCRTEALAALGRRQERAATVPGLAANLARQEQELRQYQQAHPPLAPEEEGPAPPSAIPLAEPVIATASQLLKSLRQAADSLLAVDRALAQAKLDRAAEAEIQRLLAAPLQDLKLDARRARQQAAAGSPIEAAEALLKATPETSRSALRLHARQLEVVRSSYDATAARIPLASELNGLLRRVAAVKVEELRAALELEGVTALARATSMELREAFRENQLEEDVGELEAYRVLLEETLLQALVDRGENPKGVPAETRSAVGQAVAAEMSAVGAKAAQEAAQAVEREAAAELAGLAQGGGFEAGAAAAEGAGAAGPEGQGISGAEGTGGPEGQGAPEGKGQGTGAGDPGAGMPGPKALAGEGPGGDGPPSRGYFRRGEGAEGLVRAMDFFDENEYARIVALTARHKPAPPPKLKDLEVTATLETLQRQLGQRAVDNFAALLYLEEGLSGADGQAAIRAAPGEAFRTPPDAGPFFTGVPYFGSDPVLDGEGGEAVWQDPQAGGVWLPHNQGQTRIRMGWNARGLWVFLDVVDKSGEFDVAPPQQFWNGDCVEFWFDMRNTKAKNIAAREAEHSQQFWAWAQRGGELWDTRSGAAPGQPRGPRMKRGQWAAAKLKSPYTGYHLELLIARQFLANLDRFRAGNILGFHFCLNHNWKDDLDDVYVNTRFGSHSDRPDMWGNLMLAGAEAELRVVDQDGKPLDKPRLEIGQPLFLEIRDPDRNLDPGIEDRISVLASIEGGDWEGLELRELGTSSGIFRGAVLTTFEWTRGGDGLLTVLPGDPLAITYLDQFRRLNQPERELKTVLCASTPLYTLQRTRDPARRPRAAMGQRAP